MPIASVKSLRTSKVSAAGFFPAIKLIFQCKTETYLSKDRFPNEFHVTYTKKHWSNFEKCVDLLQKIKFPNLWAKKIGCPKDQFSLIIMNTFMGQDNMNIESLCLQNNCELVIVLHNLTKKFQPLVSLCTFFAYTCRSCEHSVIGIKTY